MQKKIDRPTRKAMNLFFVLFLAIGSLMAGTVALFYRTEINTFFSEMKEREWHVIDRHGAAIGDEFDAIVSDLMFLSRQNELHDYLENGSDSSDRAVLAEYITMAAAKRIYDQIRYMDAQGREIFRVNFNGGNPGAVSKEDLQDKSKRYYFKDAFVLGEGEVFVSPLDLNVEQGRVELPFKPMIRFGTPVFDDNGGKRGIVLLNYLAANLLNILDEETAGKQSDIMLVNATGYWLLHPDREKAWGFMFKDRAGVSMASAYPREWQMMIDQRRGQVQTENGLFTFSTVYPLKEGYRSSSGSGEPYRPSVKDLDPEEYFWVLVSHIPATIMSGHTRKLMSRLFLIGAGLFVVISYGAWQLALAITRRRMYQAQLEQMALTDALTGLPNRKLFFDRLEEGVAHSDRHGRKLGLLYIDLDGFKGVNDTMGHDAGDELLIQVGGALEKVVRKADTVARLGGDEFAVILFEIKVPDDALRVGEKIVATMGRPFSLKAGTAHIGASVGAAVFPDHEDTATALIQRADTAMYQAKSRGKHSCVLATDSRF